MAHCPPTALWDAGNFMTVALYGAEGPTCARVPTARWFVLCGVIVQS